MNLATDAYAPLFEKFAFRATTVFFGNFCRDMHVPRHFDSGFVHFIRSGIVEISVPGQAPILVDEPALVFFPRSHVHSIRTLENAGVDIYCACVEFKAAQNNPLSLSFPNELVVPVREMPKLVGILDALFSEGIDQELGWTVVMDSLCVVALVQMTRHLLERGQILRGALAGLRDRRTAAALKTIHAEFANAIVLEDLAQTAGMSRARFSLHFKAVVGQTPFEYLAAYRMGIAQKLLKSRQPIKHIAADVGYESVSAFNRVFRSFCGMTPREWRNLAVSQGIRTRTS